MLKKSLDNTITCITFNAYHDDYLLSSGKFVKTLFTRIKDTLTERNRQGRQQFL